MKGGNTDSKAGEVQGFDYDGVERYGSVDMTGGKKGNKGKKGKKSPKFDEFDFEKEWKEFETSYNQKYGGASKKKKTSSAKKPTKKTSSAKKPTKKTSSAKKPAKKATKPKRKTQSGGDDSAATFAPAQMFDEKATMSAPPTGPFQSAYGLDRNLAPYPNSSGQQTGGAKKKKTSKAKKPKTATKTAKPKKDSKKDAKKDTKNTGKKVSVLDKIKKFFAM
jgi:hypothetical protein